VGVDGNVDTGVGGREPWVKEAAGVPGAGELGTGV